MLAKYQLLTFYIMRKESLFLIVALLMTVTFYGQNNKIIQKKAPISIYTFNLMENDINSTSALNERLKLTNYKFVTVDLEDIETNTASLDFKYLDRKPSNFIYDDYKKYQDNNLLKGFLLKNDPTRWNLHRIENRIQPSLLNNE